MSDDSTSASGRSGLETHFGWDEFLLELAVVVVFGLAAVVVTLEMWPAPYMPLVWGLGALLIFSGYRFATQLWRDDSSADRRARPVAESAADADHPNSRDEQLKQMTGEIAGIDIDRVDDAILERSEPQQESDGASPGDEAYLDWNEAVDRGLVSRPEVDGEPDESGETDR